MAQILYKDDNGVFSTLYDVNLTKEDRAPLINKLNELGILSSLLDDNTTIANNIEASMNNIANAVSAKDSVPNSNSVDDIITSINGINTSASGVLSFKLNVSCTNYGVTSKSNSTTVNISIADGVAKATTGTSTSAQATNGTDRTAVGSASISNIVWTEK